MEHFVGRRDKLIQMQTPQQQWETTKKASLCQQTKMINVKKLASYPARARSAQELLTTDSASGATSIPPCNKKSAGSQEPQGGYQNIRN